MRPVYYQIELTPRQLTILLVAVALLLVVAFGLGYGAAWSVLAHAGPEPGTKNQVASASTPVPIPTSTVVVAATPTRARQTRSQSTPTAVVPTPTRPRSTPTEAPPVQPAEVKPPLEEEFWVQVLASRRHSSIEEARQQLVDLGFPRDHHRVLQSTSAEGVVLYKLRVGPFPDRSSASRVQRRMRGSGFPDAWLVTP